MNIPRGLHMLIEQADQLGACDDTMRMVRLLTSYEEAFEHPKIIVWLEWLANAGLMPSKFLINYLSTMNESFRLVANGERTDEEHAKVRTEQRKILFDDVVKWAKDKYEQNK